ncbi:unnamed protein product [Closterium sp. NIES-64]|nr:unnamed protein product [Closterium sp. NIES-64]
MRTTFHRSRKEQEEEERREEEEMAVRVEAAIRERVGAELACERVQQQVAAMVAAGRQKLREEVQAQLEREKQALLAEARRKETGSEGGSEGVREVACERVQQQVAAMVAAGRQKLREEVQAQVEREKLALLAYARRKEVSGGVIEEGVSGGVRGEKLRELTCERVQQQVAAMVAAGFQKLREEVRAQVERGNLALERGREERENEGLRELARDGVI